MTDREPIGIRSYRACFALERRIHRIDRWRLPVPYGVPLRGIGYALAALAAVLLSAHLPLIGPLVGAVHPAIRLVVAPCVTGIALTRIEVDGRVAHAHCFALLRFRLCPTWSRSGRQMADPNSKSRLGDLWLAPDGQGSKLRAVRIHGPCRALVCSPVAIRRRGRRVKLRSISGPPTGERIPVDLVAGDRLVVR